MKIVVLADTHITASRTVCNDNLDAVKAYVAGHGADLAIHLGDIAADGATFPEQLRFASESFEDFGAPIRFVPGNHDVGDSPVAPGRISDAEFHRNDARVNEERLATYRSMFGADYWSIDAEGWQLIGLNAQLFATDIAAEDEQMAWLEEALHAREGSVGLFLHKPFFRNSHADTEAHVRYLPAERRRRLVDLLSGRALKFVCSGHVHQDRSLIVNGVEHRWVPSASICAPDAMQERIGDKVVGIRILELSSDGTYRIEAPAVPGLELINVVHHPEIDPRMEALRIELGTRAEL